MTNVTDTQLVAIYDALVSHAQVLGRFDRVNGHAIANAPGSGVFLNITFGRYAPVPAGSGLASTSGVLIFFAQAMAPWRDGGDLDGTERAMLTATAALVAEYHGDLDLGTTNVRNVDVLGQSGTPLSVETGYTTVGDARHRVHTITLPLIVNDLFDQVM